MSRIGKLPIQIPSGVQVTLSGTQIAVKGPKGQLDLDFKGHVDVTQGDEGILVARPSDSIQDRAYHGLYQRLIANMVKGVTEGFQKTLILNGVGYRASVQGQDLVMSLGYSHDVHYPIPTGIEIKTPQPTQVEVSGIDKQQVGQVASEIRAWRKPEPYKGKGIRYSNEVIRRKEGKSGGK